MQGSADVKQEGGTASCFTIDIAVPIVAVYQVRLIEISNKFCWQRQVANQ